MKKILFAVLSAFAISGCDEKFPVIDDFGNHHYQLLTQDSIEVTFPDFLNGHYVVIGYIFTNCPDICPLTTNNMRRIQERVKEEGIPNVRFISLSFDPEVDRPNVLKKYAELRKLDERNWTFLTGEKPTIDSLIKQVGFLAIPSDSTTTNSGEKIYYYVHTDRISVIDSQGKIRKNYRGSDIDLEEVVSDIKYLTN